MKIKNIFQMMNAALFLALASCVAPPPAKPPVMPIESAPIVPKPMTAVETKRKEVSENSQPLKGKFLDYIYLIRPDHKAEGYSINTTQLSDGYAFGKGPYDGWLVEFFLFRGERQDLVFEQVSGYEIKESDRTYGFQLTPYFFKDGKMTKASLKKVLPIKEIEKLYARYISRLKKQAGFGEEWKYFKLIKLPIKGTTIELKTCKQAPEPPIALAIQCALVGQLEWAQSKFKISSIDDIVLSTETF